MSGRVTIPAACSKVSDRGRDGVWIRIPWQQDWPAPRLSIHGQPDEERWKRKMFFRRSPPFLLPSTCRVSAPAPSHHDHATLQQVSV